ncbi:MAG: alpha-galactosidase, partial [Clostridia bacterium]|nr:alpha-galactosidase [Clostridia bacterium]
MIDVKDQVFRLTTEKTSYWFRITPFGHLEHIHYGNRLIEQPVDGLPVKRTAAIGSSVIYDESDSLYCLDHLCLEWSGIGKGDYRHSPCEVKMPDGSFTTDFIYQSHKITKENTAME